MANRLLEKYVQVVRMDGINTNKNVTIGVNGVLADLSVSGDLTVGGSINFAATTFDDPVNFQDTVTFESGADVTFQDTATFDAPITFNNTADFTNNLIVSAGTCLISGVSLNTLSSLNGNSASVSFNPDTKTFSWTPLVNQTINFENPTTHPGAELVMVLTSNGGGETVDFTGADTVSTGTLNMGAGAGDIFVVCFVSNGTKWCETSRTAAQS